MPHQHIRAGEVPELIQKTAKEFAGVFYNEGRTERFRTIGISEKAYIRRYWPNFVGPVVQVLSKMLAQPGTRDEDKTEIYQAIVDFQNRGTATPKPPMSLRSLN